MVREAESARDTASEYDPLFEREAVAGESQSAEAALAAFEFASRSYLSSPIPWLAWAILLPGAALATRRIYATGGPGAALLLWSVTILVGGLVEGGLLLRGRARGKPNPLGRWAMRVQGNLSLVAVALSVVCLAADAPWVLPGIWLLLLGHSFFSLGGLAFRPLRVAGLLYQAGGLASFAPGLDPLLVFAATTALGNLWVAIGILRRDSAVGRMRG